ncbi:DUF1831 domain-containing protein [Streptococcus dentasini]
MAFEKTIYLPDCHYSYSINPNLKKYTLGDMTFTQNKLGHYELNRLLEEIPNSGNGFPLKITINKDLQSFKLIITDQSGLRQVNIFKTDKTRIIQDKFYFLMDSLVERDVFTKTEI